MTLTYKEVAEILKIIDSSQCDEVVLEVGETRLVVRRGAAAASPPLEAAPRSDGPVSANPNPRPAPRADARVPEPVGQGVPVRAPMVGTFYARPSPNEADFVEAGARVKAGDPLCLIEVMKLYTTIEAPCDGTVESVLIENASLVEFDQLLFVIAPD